MNIVEEMAVGTFYIRREAGVNRAYGKGKEIYMFIHTRTHKHPQAYKPTHAIILHIIKENTHAKS